MYADKSATSDLKSGAPHSHTVCVHKGLPNTSGGIYYSGDWKKRTSSRETFMISGNCGRFMFLGPKKYVSMTGRQTTINTFDDLPPRATVTQKFPPRQRLWGPDFCKRLFWMQHQTVRLQWRVDSKQLASFQRKYLWFMRAHPRPHTFSLTQTNMQLLGNRSTHARENTHALTVQLQIL